MITPLDYYRQTVARGDITEDQCQLQVVRVLQQIFDAVVAREHRLQQWWSRLLLRVVHPPAIRGLYLWGSVGVGKTLMMDSFFQCLPVPKLRLHFHQFMQDIHQRLRDYQGAPNPLVKIARDIAATTRVLCFDELFVSNITDAMILGELFKALLQHDLCLVATSNVAPDDLYKEGLQRERFLPAIEVIKQATTVFHLNLHHDYRLDHLIKAGVYFTPLGNAADVELEKVFKQFAHPERTSYQNIELFGRVIKTRAVSDTVVWFDFVDICAPPRSQKDYLALVERYPTILVSNIPVIGRHEHNIITAMINFIDVLYDARTRLVVSAAAPIAELYPEGIMSFEFKRAQSRLYEMQSADYFTKE